MGSRRELFHQNKFAIKYTNLMVNGTDVTISDILTSSIMLPGIICRKM